MLLGCAPWCWHRDVNWHYITLISSEIWWSEVHYFRSVFWAEAGRGEPSVEWCDAGLCYYKWGGMTGWKYEGWGQPWMQWLWDSGVWDLEQKKKAINRIAVVDFLRANTKYVNTKEVKIGKMWLWSILCRCSKPTWMLSWATYSREPALLWWLD